MLKINYRDFYDIPRMFFVHHAGELYLFDCSFDDELDEYPDSYQVYLMPELTDDELDATWENIHLKAIRKIGAVQTNSVQFDSSLREKIDEPIFEVII